MTRTRVLCSLALLVSLAGCERREPAATRPAATGPAASQPVTTLPGASLPATTRATTSRAADTQPTRPATRPALEVAGLTVTADGVTVARLSNGLTVIVAENHNVPVVCVRAYVRTGSLYEGKYLGTGVSHLCEHLVAKGAVHEGQAAKAKQTRDRVDDIGGQSNAYTSLDDTCYYIAAAAGKTNDCIDLIADWMARPEISEEDFAREHGVVQRELAMGLDSPNRQHRYAHMRNFYGTHPAAVPIIGLAAPLAKLTRADVLDYHRRMYVPQNMVMAIVGDIDTDDVIKRARQAFAGFAPGRVPGLSLPEVAPISGTRRVIQVSRTAGEVSEYLSFQTIPLVHEDLYALDVLAYILTGGGSSRLIRKVKRGAL